MMDVTPLVQRSWKGANGSFRVMTTVCSSGVSTDSTLSWPVRERTATSGFMIVSQVNCTSRELNGSPSCHLASSRRVNVQVNPSSEMPPFSLVGISAARLGVNVPSGVIFMRLSNMRTSGSVSGPVFV